MAQSDEAKRLIQSERRRLSRMASSTESNRMERARQALRNAGQMRQNADMHANDEALYKGLKTLIQGVESTWGINTPINMEMTHNNTLFAATDFRTIRINYPEAMVPKKGVGAFDLDKLKSFVADVKGISYHEIGHIRFTIPYVTLYDLVYPGSSLDSKYHQAWNVLEDQRMEAAVVEDSPIIAGYFTTMVLQHMLNNFYVTQAEDSKECASQWLLMIGRRYLPFDIRRDFRRKFINHFGVDTQLLADQIVGSYMTATTPQEMWQAVVAYQALVESLHLRTDPSGSDSHENPYGRTGRPSAQEGSEQKETLKKLKDMLDKSASKGLPQESFPSEDEQGEGSASGQGNEEGDEEEDRGQGAGDGEGDDEGEGESAQPKASSDNSQKVNPNGENAPGSPGGHGAGKKSIGEQMKEVVDELRDIQTQDSSVMETIRDIHSNAHKKTSSLPVYRAIEAQDSARVTEAEACVQEIVKSLECYTAEDAPIWQTHQTRGIIDPFAYRTKSGGSMEYRRQYADHGGQSIDLAVTVMLDASGSMSGHEYSLGAAAYACKKACELLDIPCTVSIFEDVGSLLWGPEDKADHVAVLSGGGTNPLGTCEVLDEQQGDKTNHLVMVMTDGQFNNGFPGFHQYGNDGRYFIAFLYGGGWGYGLEALKAHRPHEAYNISNLMDIPKALTGFLSAFMR